MAIHHESATTTITVPYTDYLIHETIGYNSWRSLFMDEEQVKTLLETAMDVQRRQDAELMRKLIGFVPDDRADIRGILAALAEQLELNTIPPVSICRENGTDDSFEDYTPL